MVMFDILRQKFTISRLVIFGDKIGTYFFWGNPREVNKVIRKKGIRSAKTAVIVLDLITRQ